MIRDRSPLVAGVVAGLPPALVVLFFDEVEGLAESFGISGGPAVFLVAIPLLAVAFLVATVCLALLTAEPRRGMWPLALVGIAAMAPLVVTAAFDYGPFVFVLALPFMALITGFAALSAWTAQSMVAWLDER